MNHLHLILKAKSNILSNHTQMHEEWVKDLVDGLGMKLLETEQGANPISALCDKDGNEGITVACVIETSHIVLHTWPLKEEMQLDVYTCGKMDIDFILSHMQWFTPYEVQFRLFDRKYDLVELRDSTISDLGVSPK